MLWRRPTCGSCGECYVLACGCAQPMLRPPHTLSSTTNHVDIHVFLKYAFRIHDFNVFDLTIWAIISFRIDQAYLFVMSPPWANSFIYLRIHAVDLQTKAYPFARFANSTRFGEYLNRLSNTRLKATRTDGMPMCLPQRDL